MGIRGYNQLLAFCCGYCLASSFFAPPRDHYHYSTTGAVELVEIKPTRVVVVEREGIDQREGGGSLAAVPPMLMVMRH